MIRDDIISDEVKICKNEDYYNLLKTKLNEDIESFNFKDPYHYAEIVEILYALMDYNLIPQNQVERCRRDKLERLGKFTKGRISEQS